MADLQLLQRQLACQFEADPRYGYPLRTLSAGDAGFPRGALELRLREQPTGDRRRWRQSHEPGNENGLELFRTAHGPRLSLSRQDRCPTGLRDELHLVPG